MSTTCLPPRTHPVLDALRAVDAALDQLTDAPLWTLADAELLAAREALEAIDARVTAARWGTTREVDTRGAAVAAGATSTTAWLISCLGQDPGDAAREVRLAEQVTPAVLPATAAALEAGELRPAAAAVIADTDRKLAGYAGASDRAAADQLLAEQARTLNVRQLGHAAAHLRHHLDPEQGTRLQVEERDQVARRELRLRANPDGSATLGGYLDKEAAALLAAALDPLSKPRPTPPSGDADGQPDRDPAGHAGPAGVRPDRDRRSPAQRRGDALVELAELAIRSGQLPQQAEQPVQLVVAIRLEDLERRLTAGGVPAGAGLLDTGEPLSVAAVRRLACDAQVIPVVLGARGEPLDVGRATRTISPALRRALEVRDGGCAFPGCTRPTRWTAAHHIQHWSHGGPTALHNLVLLCPRHHQVVHHDGWDVHIDSDQLPSFFPPRWIDPDRRRRRNTRLRHLTAGPSPAPPPPGRERPTVVPLHGGRREDAYADSHGPFDP